MIYMMKIGIFGGTEERKQMEEVLLQYLNKNHISSNITQSYDSMQMIKNCLFKNDFHLYMICAQEKVSYVLRVCDGLIPKDSCFANGTVNFPLTYDEIDKIPINRL